MPEPKVSLTTKDVAALMQLARSGQLKLQLQFGRKNLWPIAAKACFIDSILNGRPVPPIYFLRISSAQTGQTEFAIIDGQKRIGAVMEFLNGGFGLTRLGHDSIATEFKGKKFSGLPVKLQKRLLNFEFVVLELFGYRKSVLQDLYELLPAHTLQLSQQEMRRISL